MKTLLVLCGIFSIFSQAEAVQSGDPAPQVVAKDQDGRDVKLSDYRGQWVLMYFYPKDDTPGCTKQACDLRDGFTRFKRAGIKVFGISTQSAESHRKFREKYGIPFDLIVDENHTVGDAFKIDRYPLVGIYKRQTVLIDPNGKVARRMNDVDPGKHADEILKFVESTGTGK